jgi:probable 2-oxoglutarate dehydrogenase E1 component DHKTD1
MRLHGHRAANIDPLGLTPRRPLPAVNPARYGLHPEQSYDINGILYTDDEDRPKHWALERIVQRLQSVYLGTLAHEYMHSISKAERLWFSRVLEGDDHAAFHSDDPARRRIWKLLVRSEIFDQFLHLRFPGLKRYGLEGSESMLPALDTLFQQAALGALFLPVGSP